MKRSGKKWGCSPLSRKPSSREVSLSVNLGDFALSRPHYVSKFVAIAGPARGSVIILQGHSPSSQVLSTAALLSICTRLAGDNYSSWLPLGLGFVSGLNELVWNSSVG